MRPVRLELKGFTSFRDDQAIDFDGLDLFAIAGPTGSGKSIGIAKSPEPAPPPKPSPSPVVGDT